MATPAQWFDGARPRTWAASISPVMAGSGAAAAADSFVWWKATLALLVGLLLQIGCNYANDYSDGIRGTDEHRVGPQRLVGSGAAPPRRVKAAAMGCFAVAATAGVVLAATSAWWLLLVGAAAIAAAWYYTGGSRPYGYHGLGEVFVFVFFGPVAVVGTTFVQAGRITVTSILVSVAVGALTCAILVANNVRDIPTDEASGKRTLAVILGERATRASYLVLVGAAYLLLISMALTATGWVLLAVLALPLALRPVRAVLGGATGGALIPVLRDTGLAELLYAALLTVGLALSA